MLAVAGMLFALGGPTQWDVEPPGQCHERGQLDQRTTDLLGRAVAPGELSVRIKVRGGGPMRAEIVLEHEGRVETRELRSDDCDALVDAIALLVAVTLDPDEPAVPPPPRRAESPPPTPTAPQPHLPDATAADETSTTPRRDVGQWALGLAAGGELGAIPGGTGGIRPFVHWRRRRFAITVSGDYWIRRTTNNVRVELGLGGLRACAVMGRRRITVPVCGGGEAGVMRGAGIRLADGRARSRPWVALLASAGVLAHLGARVALRADLEPFVPVVRPSFEGTLPSGEAVVLHEPSPIGVRLLAGIAIRFQSSVTGSRSARESP